MKLETFIFAILLGFSTTAFSDPAAESEAEKLLNIIGMEEVFDQTITQMLDLEMQKNPSLAPFRGVMMEFFRKHMSYEVLKPDLLKIYADEFTADELKDINTFYSTSTGQKTIQKMPDLITQGAELGSIRVQQNLPELQQMIQTEAERIQNAQ